jgi:RNA ligase (TIGR02306 family)
MSQGLVYIGQVINIEPIPNADRIERLDVACGPGGNWSGVTQKGEYQVGGLCRVYLQDSVLPQTPEFDFMSQRHYRVRMARLRGVPSECLVMPLAVTKGYQVGDDITELAGVTKYEKPIPVNMSGKVVGAFPSFIPKTDEPNFQAVPEMVEALQGQLFYATEKADGTSATFFFWEDRFGVCSRNWELEPEDHNLYWRMARKYHLPDILAHRDYAIQAEIIGPNIQGNPYKLAEPQIYVFDIYNIAKRCYLDGSTLQIVLENMGLPMVPIVAAGTFRANAEQLRVHAEGKYPSGVEREGIVIRPLRETAVNGKRLSFKVLNLKYK